MRAPEQPNIVFIFSDDHSTRAIGAYGSVVNETPNLDRLARDGMRFDHCLVTNAICAPSRAVVLTGKYSHVNGQMTNRETFDGSQATFPKLLREAGYETAVIGKWHLKSAPTGFDYWRVLVGQGPYYNPPIAAEHDTTVVEGYTTDIITDLAIEWLSALRDESKPFLLMFQHKAPHRRWDPGPEHLGLYDDRDLPMPSTFFDDYAGRGTAARQANMRVDRNLTARDLKIIPPEGLTAEQLETWNAVYEPRNRALRDARLSGEDLDRWKYQRYIKDYVRSVASVDDNVGRLLDFLDEAGLSENTLVVYSSDQGWYLGEHGWYDKRWMYEESLTAPLIVRWPGRTPAGSVNERMVSNLDFAATFLDVAGVAVPEDMQGRSLKAVLQDNNPEDWRRSFYYHYYEYPADHCVQRHYGVRTERYKLIHFYLLGEWELYDLREDPDEMTSLYGDPAYAGLVDSLKSELSLLRTEYAVPSDTVASGPCTFDAEGWDGFQN
jgi:arylsulfatase A-like enzyme